jgi:SpoVK/Ycf46/Vps4 family AAA+-type ATPase
LRKRSFEAGANNSLVCGKNMVILYLFLRFDVLNFLLVMLSMVEYYSGVLMLTTNRPEEIDPAFASRLDLHLPFPPLRQASRQKLWESFLRTVSSKEMHLVVSVSASEFEELASWELNGRQIKNIIKNSVRWCFLKKETISFDRLATAMKVTVPSAQREGAQTSASTLGKRQRLE